MAKNSVRKFVEQYGEWAVVTGASCGIGRAIAEHAAKRGLNVALVARSVDALLQLASQIEARCGVQTKVVAADLSKREGRVLVMDSMVNCKVGMLVNSAGFGSSGELLGQDIESELDMVEVNCKALLELTYHFARRFVDQRHGGIVMLSSLASFQGGAYASNYAATKAYVQSLSEGLAEELAPFGVDVLACAPGPTKTGFEARSGMRFSRAESVEVVARQSLEALGKQANLTPGKQAKFLHAALNTAPRFLRVKIMKQVMRSMMRG